MPNSKKYDHEFIGYIRIRQNFLNFSIGINRMFASFALWILYDHTSCHCCCSSVLGI